MVSRILSILKMFFIMKLLYVLRRLLPSFIQNLVKYIYMRWNISWRMCKLVQLTPLMNWSIKIGKKVYVWKWDVNIDWLIEIGDYVSLNDRIIMYTSDKFKIKIGKYCSVANWASFIATLWHNYSKLTTYRRYLNIKNYPDLWWNIEIWNDVWIWKNAIIMKWVTIWTWAVIWAWAIVTKDIPPYAIAVWNPAKVIKYRFDEDTIKKLLESERRNRDIEKIKANYNLEFIKN